MGLFRDKVKQHLTEKYKDVWMTAIKAGDLEEVKRLAKKIDVNVILTNASERGIDIARQFRQNAIVDFLMTIDEIIVNPNVVHVNSYTTTIAVHTSTSNYESSEITTAAGIKCEWKYPLNSAL